MEHTTVIQVDLLFCDLNMGLNLLLVASIVAGEGGVFFFLKMCNQIYIRDSSAQCKSFSLIWRHYGSKGRKRGTRGRELIYCKCVGIYTPKPYTFCKGIRQGGWLWIGVR